MSSFDFSTFRIKKSKNNIFKKMTAKKIPSFKSFTDKYGDDTSTNFQLINWARHLNIKPFYCLMRDEISELKNKKKYFAIVNIHKSNEAGVHWSFLHKNELGNRFFFDSYGIDPVQEIIDLRDSSEIEKPILCNTFQLQNQGKRFYGQMCLYVLWLLSKNYQFEDVILSLKNELS